MALQTITYSVGDYAYQSWSNAYVLELTLTEDSIDKSKNCSTISYELKIKSGSSNQYESNTPYGISLNGKEITSGVKGLFLQYNSSVILTSGTTTVDHNLDGTLNMSINAWINESYDEGGASNRFAPPAMSISENMTLTTISVPYTITFNAGEGNFGKDSSGNKIYTKYLTKYKGDTLLLSDIDIPTRGSIQTSFNINGTTYLDSNITQGAFKYQNFVFSSWNTQPDGSGISYTSNESYYVNSDVTLYAIYEYNYTYSNNIISGNVNYPWWTITKDPILNATYTVTFNGNGGTCSISELTADKITTYILDGWYSSPYGSGTKYNNNSSFTSQITIYANWISTTSTESIKLPTSDTVTRKGYDFKYWNSAASGKGTIYSAGSSYAPTSNITLYAFYGANGLIRIYTGGVYREALVWVFDGTKWVQAMPNVFNGTEWKIGG